jgi:hypothetical protein
LDLIGYCISRLGNASVLAKTPIAVLEGDDRIAATDTQSAGISCRYDSTISLSAIGSGLRDAARGDDANETRSTARSSTELTPFHAHAAPA